MTTLRSSNFECLRIVSIVLIVAMHILGNAFQTQNLLNKELILAVNTVGNMGVTLFVFISGYFGIRFNIRKLAKVLFTVWFYSLLSYAVQIIWFDVPFSNSGLTIALFPVLCKKYWFITCYLILYCFSPYINQIIHALNRHAFERLLLIWGFFFVIAPTILLFEIQNDYGKGVINLTLAYLIGQYLSKYGFPNWLRKHAIKIFIGCLLFIFGINLLLTLNSGNIVLKFARDNGFFILLGSAALFYLFSRWQFTSRVINYLASYVFALYLLQPLFIRWLAPWYKSSMNSDSLILYFVVGLSLICLLSFLIEWSRRMLLEKAENRLAAFLEKKFEHYL